MAKYEELFVKKSVWGAIISMAVPSVITVMVMILYNMADMFFIGQMGDARQGCGNFDCRTGVFHCRSTRYHDRKWGLCHDCKISG